MDLRARKHHRGWRYKWCLLFPVLADVLFAGCSDLTARTHIYCCTKVRRPQLFYSVDLGLWHSGSVGRAETISNFQAKVFPLNSWGRTDRQLWVPTLKVTAFHWNANLDFQKAPVSLCSAQIWGRTRWNCTQCVKIFPLPPQWQPRFWCLHLKNEKTHSFFLFFSFNLYQYIQGLWFGILTFSHLPSPVWTQVACWAHVLEMCFSGM